MRTFFNKIRDANQNRKMETFPRCLLKVGEEYGEANQAYLSVSSAGNGKNKSWSDVREELIDTLVVTTDLLLHTFPDQGDLSEDQRMAEIESILERKLKKWNKKQTKNGDTSVTS